MICDVAIDEKVKDNHAPRTGLAISDCDNKSAGRIVCKIACRYDWNSYD